MVEEFYQHDKKTAYIFTADHGMTNWGKLLNVYFYVNPCLRNSGMIILHAR
jgi:hypothetical protein